MMPGSPIVLDVSRLLSRAARRVPTGIDRVEHGYAETLLRLAPERLRYAALHPLGRFCHLPTARTRHFVERIGWEWQNAMPTGDAAEGAGADVRGLARRLHAGMMLPHGTPRFVRGREPGAARPAYVIVSHHHLHNPKAIQAAKDRLDARFICFLHDLIPTEFPEYNRPLEGAKHLRRVQVAVQMADALVVSTEAVRDSLLPHIRAAGRDVPLLVTPLGVQTHPAPAVPGPAASGPPYFLCIGTIEPRKNHLLLLHAWRRLSMEMGERTPRLVLVGQRGWENEMVLDVLERSEVLRDHVVEYNALPDAEVQTLMRGACAVLMPSFAEGYGLPVAEALAAGAPVLCSDLPALREVGGDAAEFLDPIDGLGWLAAIRDYARPDSPRRQRQMQRLLHWSPPVWTTHVEAVMGLIDGLPR